MMRTLQRTHSAESLAALQSHSNRASRRLRGRLQLSLNGYRWVNIEVPNELWGAASLALQLCARKSVGPRLARAASTVARALAPPFETAAPPEYPQSITDALNFSPELTVWEDGACLAVSIAACIFIYSLTVPATLSLLYGAGMAALCAAFISLSRAWLLERQYKAVQRTEKELASPDSLFLNIDGVALHYKRALDAPHSNGGGSFAAAIHCLHGFGASSYSWSFVQRELARACSSLVTAHDMPGFGLSQRPSASQPYSLAFNGTAAKKILAAELKKVNGTTKRGTVSDSIAENLDTNSGNTTTDLKNSISIKTGGDSEAEGVCPKVVLIGHSMGGAAAAEGFIRSPEGVAGLVLVAPAIVALWKGVPEGAKSDVIATGVALTEELLVAEDPPGEVGTTGMNNNQISTNGEGVGTRNGTNGSTIGGLKSGSTVRRPLGRVVAALIQAVTSELVRLVLVMLTPVLVLLLRRLVRAKSFWERGLAAAWVDKSRVTSQYVDRYRLGQLVKGWEYGILRFMGARFSEKAGLWHAVAAALEGDGHLSQAERLAAACAATGVKVLIIHGVDDVLVPVANSKRLASLIPGSKLVVVDKCGHMPHEERPELFVEEVQAFVQSLV